jgi:hypothetical protein
MPGFCIDVDRKRSPAWARRKGSTLPTAHQFATRRSANLFVRPKLRAGQLPTTDRQRPLVDQVQEIPSANQASHYIAPLHEPPAIENGQTTSTNSFSTTDSRYLSRNEITKLFSHLASYLSSRGLHIKLIIHGEAFEVMCLKDGSEAIQHVDFFMQDKVLDVQLIRDGAAHVMGLFPGTHERWLTPRLQREMSEAGQKREFNESVQQGRVVFERVDVGRGGKNGGGLTVFAPTWECALGRRLRKFLRHTQRQYVKQEAMETLHGYIIDRQALNNKVAEASLKTIVAKWEDATWHPSAMNSLYRKFEETYGWRPVGEKGVSGTAKIKLGGWEIRW